MNFFEGKCNELYINEKKQFKSYFITFQEGSRLELMQKVSINSTLDSENEYIGYVHIAYAVENKEKVISLTKQLKNEGYQVLNNPRTTGDGYFESIVADPDGNKIEITCD